MADNFFYPNMYGQQFMPPRNPYGVGIDDRMAGISRTQMYSQQAREMSYGSLSKMLVGKNSWSSSVGEWGVNALSLGFINIDNQLDRARGIGVKSKYLTQRDQNRIITGEMNRRLDRVAHLYGRSPVATTAQFARDFAGILGWGDIYDNTIGMFGLENRTKLDASEKLTSFLKHTMTRADLQGAENEGLKYQQKLAEIMADPTKLRGRVSDRELEEFKETSGFRDYKILGYRIPGLRTQQGAAFTLDEQRQLMMAASQQGEFEGSEAMYVTDPVTGQLVAAGTARTKGDILKQRDNAINQQALRSQKMLNSVRLVQEELGITDPAEAQKITKLIAGAGKMGDLKRGDIQRITSLQEQLGISIEGIQMILESGDQIAKSLGLTQAQGRAISMQNARSVKNLRSLGIISDTTAAAVGGTEGLSERLMGATQEIAASATGKRYRGARAMVELIRQREGDAAANAMLQRIQSEYKTTGTISKGTAAESMKLAGYKNVQAGYVDIELESRSGYVDKQLSKINTEGEQLNLLLERARNQGGDESRQISLMMNDSISGGIAQRLGVPVLRELLLNKTSVKDALEKEDSRRGTSELAQKLAEINSTYTDEGDRRTEISKALKELKIEDQYDLEDLVGMSGKSVTKLEGELGSKNKEANIGKTFGDRYGWTWFKSIFSGDASKRYSKVKKFREREEYSEKAQAIRDKELKKLDPKEAEIYRNAAENQTQVSDTDREVYNKIERRIKLRTELELGKLEESKAELQEKSEKPIKEVNESVKESSELLKRILSKMDSISADMTAGRRIR